ncbi:hypothetical protein [Bradyrhizobium liaoningense]|uniref:hypothetical protein n=1 Tax=Bradyrhizobium liaoningense TaxID=43992 RepID=UPI001BA58733|nr:hypothetical protein [Bradyrhizobium liaoningense]MBR0854337.1 hypothetical protein [Bradyrhizobium liaoningense]
MVKARDAVVWVNDETKEVRVRAKGSDRREIKEGHWSDPIGAAYSQWQEMKDDQRVVLMLETAIDLTMQGYDLGNVLRAFADVEEFKALGSSSYPMCRALTSAILGKCLEPNTMSFEELLEHYGPR